VVETAKTWIRENSTLMYFLIAQAIFLGGLAFSGWGYMVRLESRVNTLEVRGSPHLADINTRLTVLEGATKKNENSIERIVDVMTKELHVSPARDR
jgi:hypothetical protein